MARIDPEPGYTLRQLAAFVAVAETGTISAAAERVHLSPSALAGALTDLEKALKVQLTVRRRARGVQLTPTGEAVLARARLLLGQASELQADAAGEGGIVTGPIALGCYPSLGPTVLPSLLHAFTQRYPRVVVELHEDTQNRLGTLLHEGELDLAIVYALDLPPEQQTVRLSSRAPAVLLAPGHPLASVDGPLRLSDLADEPMVLLDAPPSSHHAMEVCRLAGFAPKIAYRTQNFETARSFVGRGLGWTLLVQRPEHDVTYEGLDVVVRTDLVPRPEPVDVVLAWQQGAMLSKAARACIEFVSQFVNHPS